MYVETSAMTGSGVTDLFKSIGVCIGWRLGVALKVRESMETNTKTGFQLLEVKNETPDKVLEVKWRVTGRVLDGGKKSGGCCKWLVCCKRVWESGASVKGIHVPQSMMESVLFHQYSLSVVESKAI